MTNLNFKHLRYFWMVAKSGGIARASEQLHLTPQSISGQLGELEDSLGVQLLRRVGRGLELTEMGRRIFSYADEIFALGDELLEVTLDRTAKKSLPFRIGIADAVPKSVACRVSTHWGRIRRQGFAQGLWPGRRRSVCGADGDCRLREPAI